jgi:hypothetical protein
MGGQPSFVGTCPDGEVAPIPAIRAAAIEWKGSTPIQGTSAQVN